jgi:lipopolysaccharide export system protein LptC
MARIDRHTRMVGWLKLVLPLAALAVLSTLFLLADRIDPEAALPYAEVDVEDLAEKPRMTAPTYAGTTSDGSALTLSAVEARQAVDGAPAEALGLKMVLTTPDGGTANLQAGTGTIDDATQEIVLEGGVTLDSSTGYRLETATLRARLDRTGLQSGASVVATGPVGRIEAGGMSLGQDNRTPGAYLMVFNGGVRLVYQPGR